MPDLPSKVCSPNGLGGMFSVVCFFNFRILSNCKDRFVETRRICGREFWEGSGSPGLGRLNELIAAFKGNSLALSIRKSWSYNSWAIPKVFRVEIVSL